MLNESKFMLEEAKLELNKIITELVKNNGLLYEFVNNPNSEFYLICSYTSEKIETIVFLDALGIKAKAGNSFCDLSFDDSSSIFFNRQGEVLETEPIQTDKRIYVSSFLTYGVKNLMQSYYKLYQQEKNSKTKTNKKSLEELIDLGVVSENALGNILNNMEEALDRYNWEYTESVLKDIICESIENKSELISILAKHPKWNATKLYIHFDADYERTFDIDALKDFVSYVQNLINKNGADYYTNMQKNLKNNDFSWLWKTSFKDTVGCFFKIIQSYTNAAIVSKEMEEEINRVYPSLRSKKGQKISRLINKYCVAIGLDKDKEYNRKYASLADSFSPRKIKRHTVISVNPVDYLMMSNGNSWASCHTIDKQNVENRPNAYEGCYCGGTMSYMLDGTSLVYYTVAPDKEYDLELEYKELRQMFHYHDFKLLQGRLYPQSNDGHIADELKKEIRMLMQDIFADGLGITNLWKTIGRSSYRKYIESTGSHYQDYNEFNCKMSYPKDMEDSINCSNKMLIGHIGYCIECGANNYEDGTINCCHSQRGYNCAECGAFVDYDDVRWIDDTPYCEDCVIWSDIMDEYILEDSSNIEFRTRYGTDVMTSQYYDNGNHSVFYCEHCDRYFDGSFYNHYYTTEGCICESCFESEFCYCAECEAIYNCNDMILFKGEYYCDDCFDEIKEKNEEIVETIE